MEYVSFDLLIDTFKKHFPEIVAANDLAEFKASNDRKVAQFSNHKNSIGFMAGYTCGGATDACLSECYTQRGASSWPSTERLKAHNTWILMQHILDNDLYGLVAKLGAVVGRSVDQYNRKVKTLRKKAIRSKEEDKLLRKLISRGPIFRWQWSGDLLHSLQAEAVSIISRQYPDVSFWLYTRSFYLLQHLEDKGDNLMVWLSADEDNMETAAQYQLIFPWTKIADMDERGEVGQDLVCPELREENPIPLNQACASCGICFAAKAPHLTFPLTKTSAYRKPIDSELLQIFSTKRQKNTETLAA